MMLLQQMEELLIVLTGWLRKVSYLLLTHQIKNTQKE